MSSVIKEVVEIIHSRQIFAHIGGPDQPFRLFAGRPKIRESLIQAFLRHCIVQHAAPRKSVEMIDGKTQLPVRKVRKVCRSLSSRVIVILIIRICHVRRCVFIRVLNVYLRPVIKRRVIYQIRVHITKCSDRQIQSPVVRANIDLIFTQIVCHKAFLRRILCVFDPHIRRAVQIYVVHTFLRQYHHICESSHIF